MTTAAGFAGRFARDTRIDAVVAPLQSVISTLGSNGRAADVLHGVPLRRPLHPLLVPVPIVAWTVAAALEVAGRSRTARRWSRVGLWAVVPAASPAAMDWSKLPSADQRIGMVHALAVIGAATGAAVADGLPRRRAAVAARMAGMASLGVAVVLGVALAQRRAVRGDTPLVLARRGFTGRPGEA